MTEDDVLIGQMAETIGAVFWLFDANERRILYVSPSYEQVWGRDRCFHSIKTVIHANGTYFAG